jgi:hypothetical protein
MLIQRDIISTYYARGTEKWQKAFIMMAVILYAHNLQILNCGLKGHTKTATLLGIFVFYFALI